MDGTISPAAKLEGLTLTSGWRITGRIEELPGGTGGSFSCQYTVEKNGRQAFLKALDYSKAEQIAEELGVDQLVALQSLVEAYNFERNLLYECAQKRMDRVVIALEDGSIRVDKGIFGTVFYLIFEAADGDIRRHLAIAEKVELAWILRCLHHVSTGLYQLHSARGAQPRISSPRTYLYSSETSRRSRIWGAPRSKESLARAMVASSRVRVPTPRLSCCTDSGTKNGVVVDRSAMYITWAVWSYSFSAGWA